jgi:Fe-S-cluster containining protein
MINLENGYSKEEFREKFCSKCGAHCCRVGVFVPLTDEEFWKMNEFSRALQRDVALTIERFNGKLIWVMSHNKKPCGFLDQETNHCLVYNDRPSLCREYYCEPKMRFKSSFWYKRIIDLARPFKPFAQGEGLKT